MTERQCIRTSGADSSNDWLRVEYGGPVRVWPSVEAARAHVYMLRETGMGADDRYDITYSIHSYAKVRDVEAS